MILQTCCTVNFRTETQEGTTEISSSGTFYGDENKFLLLYRIDGDEASLRYSLGTLEMRRSGAAELFGVFVKDRPTFLRFGSEGAGGRVGVTTDRLSVTLSPRRCLLEVSYTLKFGEPLHFGLRAVIDFSEES